MLRRFGVLVSGLPVGAWGAGSPAVCSGEREAVNDLLDVRKVIGLGSPGGLSGGEV